MPNPLSYIVRCVTMFLNFIFVFISMFDPFTDETYIFTAVHGDNFCTSSKQSFHLSRRNRSKIRVLRHCADRLTQWTASRTRTTLQLHQWSHSNGFGWRFRYLVLDSSQGERSPFYTLEILQNCFCVIDAVLGLGVLIVFAITAGVTYALVHKTEEEGATIAIAILLVLVVTLFFVIPIFMVLQVACDTIFLCVLEDYERHDDSETKPYYMSKKLKRLLLVNEEEIRL
ncbi:unnamed protein product [Trichogramma brassicae]|uniref:Choline transporter-like protein n=1 Tax=Trichogramma brassicae TaxID=86971 RepID=A0A6H5J5J9_9HYME|nr:unnamed protein product [Trichogramma brassicae]